MDMMENAAFKRGAQRMGQHRPSGERAQIFVRDAFGSAPSRDDAKQLHGAESEPIPERKIVRASGKAFITRSSALI